MKILVVDDERSVISSLIQALSPPHDVRGLTGGAGILSWVQNHEFDLVLLDILLPDSNGLALLTTLKQSRPDVFVIVITGAVDDGDMKNKAIAAGADAFLAKPIDLADLRTVIGRFEVRESAPGN